MCRQTFLLTWKQHCSLSHVFAPGPAHQPRVRERVVRIDRLRASAGACERCIIVIKEQLFFSRFSGNKFRHRETKGGRVESLMFRSAWNMRSPEQSIDYFCKAKKFLTKLIGNGLFLSQFYFDLPISFAFFNMSCAALKKTCCAHIHSLSLFSWTCFSRSLFIFFVIESSFVLSVHLILCSKTNCDLLTMNFKL